MHTYALAFHLWRLDFQSLFDHNRKEEREEKGENWKLLLKSLYSMHPPEWYLLNALTCTQRLLPSEPPTLMPLCVPSNTVIPGLH